MENYELLGTIGEGTYGIVLKARHKPTGLTVAIKKFKDTLDDLNDDDASTANPTASAADSHTNNVRKTALREIKILKSLKHDNIVSLLEVFRRHNQLYLVFEYVEHTLLEVLEQYPYGVPPELCRRYIYQLLRALQFIHSKGIIHRDIKPENLLISKNGVLKLCDFGFARSTQRTPNSQPLQYTDYVATRWYRSPELLVGDPQYGTYIHAVDIWAVGCVFSELLTGQPLFPGESDIDQLYLIMKMCGQLTPMLLEMFLRNTLYVGVKLPTVKYIETLQKRYPQMEKTSMHFISACLQYDATKRSDTTALLSSPYFSGFLDSFNGEYQLALQREREERDALLLANSKRRQAKHAAKQQSLQMNADKVQSQLASRPETRQQLTNSNNTYAEAAANPISPLVNLTNSFATTIGSLDNTMTVDDGPAAESLEAVEIDNKATADVDMQCATATPDVVPSPNASTSSRPTTQSRLTCYEQVLPTIPMTQQQLNELTVRPDTRSQPQRLSTQQSLHQSQQTHVLGGGGGAKYGMREKRSSWERERPDNLPTPQYTKQKKATTNILPALTATKYQQQSYGGPPRLSQSHAVGDENDEQPLAATEEQHNRSRSNSPHTQPPHNYQQPQKTSPNSNPRRLTVNNLPAQRHPHFVGTGNAKANDWKTVTISRDLSNNPYAVLQAPTAGERVKQPKHQLHQPQFNHPTPHQHLASQPYSKHYNASTTTTLQPQTHQAGSNKGKSYYAKMAVNAQEQRRRY